MQDWKHNSCLKQLVVKTIPNGLYLHNILKAVIIRFTCQISAVIDGKLMSYLELQKQVAVAG
jgi:hypothetical protein